MGRRCLSRTNSGAPGVRAASARLYPAAVPLQGSDRGRSGVGQESDEVEGASQSGARVSRDETEIRVRKSALSGAEEERAAVVCHLCAGEFVCEPQKTAARRGRVGSRLVFGP